MKKNLFILTFASLTLAVVGAKASTLNDSEITHLPAYHFETARYTPAEKAVESSLAELRASAKATAPRIMVPIVADKAATEKANAVAKIATQPAPATRLAKN